MKNVVKIYDSTVTKLRKYICVMDIKHIRSLAKKDIRHKMLI